MAAKYDLNDDRVVVIIGSGAGGGTLGNELAQKGVDVVILEAGARSIRRPCQNHTQSRKDPALLPPALITPYEGCFEKALEDLWGDVRQATAACQRGMGGR